jgi:Ca2+-binding RTX toxin-like protein
MLRRATLMFILAATAVLVVAPAVEGKTVTCKSGQVCKGTNAADWIFGSAGNDNIRAMGGNDYVFGNGGADAVAHSYGDDLIFGGCGSDTVRGGFGLDIIYANRPIGLFASGTPCRDAAVTVALSREQIDAIEALSVNSQDSQANDVADGAHDLVDCAWLGSRGDPEPDVGFGQYVLRDGTVSDTVKDTVVDCSNRDDQ